ncbi:MAG: hypothetical protein ACYC7A_17075 [Thermoanaerobaculia bacterium]
MSSNAGDPMRSGAGAMPLKDLKLSLTSAGSVLRIIATPMTALSRQIDNLARTIVNRLEDRGLVEFGDAEAGIAIVRRALTENFTAWEAAAKEARERAARVAGSRPPTDEEIELEMRKLALERGIVP